MSVCVRYWYHHSFSISTIDTFCCCSVARSCLTLCDPMDCSMPSFPVLHYPQEPAQTCVHWVGDGISSSVVPPAAFNISRIRVFSDESVFTSRGQIIGASASASVLPMNIHSGLISFRPHWFDLLLVQWILKSYLQHHSSSINSSVLRLLYGPVLTSIHDYWKNHSFEKMDLCWQSNVSAF